MSSIFEENNYSTGLFGKWHLGDNYPYRPQDRGFQEVLSFGGGGVGQNPDYWRNDYFDDVYLHNGIPELYRGYCTDIWFENAIRFIEEQNPRKTGKPFFCCIATNAPHSWFFVPNDYTLPFREKGMDDNLSRYFGMIKNIDDNIGKLRTRLKELSLKENTIFIFMTDNGQSNYKLPRSGPFYFNVGMRGTKGSNYDGGHRVPCFISWPIGGLKSGKAINQLTAHFDLMPTLIDLCRLNCKNSIDFDGKSLVPLLYDMKYIWHDRILFVHFQDVNIPEKWRKSAIMTEKFRLIDGKELYDIKNDPSQEEDIAATHPEEVNNLRREYEKWWRHISDRFDNYSRIYIGDDSENPTKLTCHDWYAEKALGVWNQDQIRNRQMSNGYWKLKIVKDGQYEFNCRIYPNEEDTRLNVVKVRIKIGAHVVERECNPGTSEVKITLDLNEGDTTLQTWFYENDGKNYGVPFVYVKRF
jgi:arylsulfatase A-like enzyme